MSTEIVQLGVNANFLQIANYQTASLDIYVPSIPNAINPTVTIDIDNLTITPILGNTVPWEGEFGLSNNVNMIPPGIISLIVGPGGTAAPQGTGAAYSLTISGSGLDTSGSFVIVSAIVTILVQNAPPNILGMGLNPNYITITLPTQAQGSVSYPFSGILYPVFIENNDGPATPFPQSCAILGNLFYGLGQSYITITPWGATSLAVNSGFTRNNPATFSGNIKVSYGDGKCPVCLNLALITASINAIPGTTQVEAIIGINLVAPA